MAIEVDGDWHEADGGSHRHDAVLLDTFQTLLGNAGIAPRDVREAVVVNGPGSFTGLRISVSFIHALDSVSPLKVLPLDQLSLIASLQPKAIQAVLDARMDEVYVGRDLSSRGLFKTLEVLPLESMQWDVNTVCHTDELDRFAGCVSSRPSLLDLRVLAAQQPLSGWVSGSQLVPQYVRHSVSWKPLSEQPSKLYDR